VKRQESTDPTGKRDGKLEFFFKVRRIIVEDFTKCRIRFTGFKKPLWAYICNLSYSKGRDWEDHGLRPA
jgi:hypothetical protein